MPLSGNFRREMLMAMKNAKKNKDKQNESEGAEGESDSCVMENASSCNKGSDLEKPVSSSRSVHIDQSTVIAPGRSIEKTKSQQ